MISRHFQNEAKLTLLQWGVFLDIKNIPAPADSHYHSKNVVLGLEKPLLGEKSARKEVFRGLKQHVLSDKT